MLISGIISDASAAVLSWSKVMHGCRPVASWCWFGADVSSRLYPLTTFEIQGSSVITCQFGRKAVVWLPLDGGFPALQYSYPEISPDLGPAWEKKIPVAIYYRSEGQKLSTIHTICRPGILPEDPTCNAAKPIINSTTDQTRLC